MSEPIDYDDLCKRLREEVDRADYATRRAVERAERAEADSAALREATGLNHADPMAVACSAALRRAEKAEADNAALRDALAWVMRTHVKDSAIINSQHTDTINAAMLAGKEKKTE